MRNARFVSRRAITGAALLFLASTLMAHAAGTAYVSPTGGDNNPGTLAQPYRTIQKCAATITSGGTCFILAGDYRETVKPNSGITIAPYQNQTVTVDGADPVTGWTLYSGNIYRAQVTLSSGDTNQVFVNGQMMTEAQWPLSYDLFHPVWATAQSGTNATTLVDSNLPNINWVGAHVHFWSGSDPWDPQTGVITASQPGTLTFTVDGASFPPYIVPQAGGYYFLFGALGALTAAGEWFYDSKAGYLYLWAPGGADPNTLAVSAKVRQYGFDLSNASNVTIQGLSLFATTINTNSSSTNNVIDGITATYVSHYTTLKDNPPYPSSYWYAHLGDSGIILNGAGNVLKNSSISYSAGNGVTVFGTNTTVQNNLIDHVDYMANYGAGIAVDGTGNVITHNTIHDTARFAIFPHSIFTYPAVGPDNLDISYNNLFNAMLVSRDGGEIYVSGAGNPPPRCVISSTIRYNWVHDTRSLYPGPASNYPLSGIYLDEDACGWQVYQNIAWNNQYNNIFIHGSTSGITTPNNNQVYNNSIPDSSLTGYIWLQDVNVCGTTAVYNNRVLVPPVQTGSACNVSNNGATAPGADMMAGVTPGCNLPACTSPLLAAVLPASRSAQPGGTVTAFATIINTGATTLSGCSIAPATSVPASFLYQTTNPATNALTGTANTPVSIPGNNQYQTFVLAFTPVAAIPPTNVALLFSCTNTGPAPINIGLNTLLLSASTTTPTPDIIALAATAKNDGIVHVTGTPLVGAFAVATDNLGSKDSIAVTADTGSASLPLTITICQSNPSTGVCLQAPTPAVTTSIASNTTPTFVVFVAASGSVPFDPANSRIFVKFTDSGGAVRGETSVAVATQ
jgi:hypothetical protein